jgi:hypothetical protein
MVMVKWLRAALPHPAQSGECRLGVGHGIAGACDAHHRHVRTSGEEIVEIRQRLLGREHHAGHAGPALVAAIVATVAEVARDVAAWRHRKVYPGPGGTSLGIEAGVTGRIASGSAD